MNARHSGMEGTQVRAVLEELLATEARFHGLTPVQEADWSLNREALDLLVDLVANARETLETGVGYSTVIFAAYETHHTVVSPFAFEHDRVRRWCTERDIGTASIDFVAKPSQDVLPALEPTPLDLVLIDGDHAFPSPFIDFYYAAGRLIPGGMLIVDDTQLRPCRLLAEFLETETERWRLHTKLSMTTVFERLDGPLIPRTGWGAQPWSATPIEPVTEPVGRSSWRARVAARVRRTS